MRAAVSSFAAFALGAVIPLIPWLVAHGTGAELASIAAAAIAAVAVGAALAAFTGRPWWWSALRQLLIATVAAGITYGIGSAVGVSSVH